jgi:four helix bundle suffix protein
MENENSKTVLRRQPQWKTLYFYQKSEVLYLLTFTFVKRYLRSGDRTIDQMVQAARSVKQNIVEGSADGVTSMEMEIKLMNVARSSIKELREDYEDYLKARHLPIWGTEHPRYDKLVKFCRNHNKIEDYQPFFDRWNDEEMANVGLSLCHYVDKMMTSYEEFLQKSFVTEGGIKERMTAARLGYRTNQREEIANLQRQLAAARQEIEALKKG